MSVAEPVAGIRAREAFVALAELYCYPDNSYAQRLRSASAALRVLDGGAAQSLDAFDAAIEGLDLGELESAYTSTFDLAPSCNPYIGAHVFGDESRERARFLVGLRRRYIAAGKDEPRELPDHIAVVFAFANDFDDEEWPDLGRLALLPALTKMDDLLRDTVNPYRHLVAATRQLAEVAFGSVEDHG